MSTNPTAAPKEAAGAPASEIEITPAMIEAGGLALYDYDAVSDPHEWVVVAIYEAMEKVRRRD